MASKSEGFMFGFVEFENASSVQSALESSPITIGDRQAAVEEKMTDTRVGSSGTGLEEEGMLQVKRGSGVTISGVEGTSVVAEEATAGMNSETRGNFQDDQRVLVDGTEITISELIKMEGAVVKVVPG
ncbi:uncharacterized protein LOC120159784 [Hibiscus syriacus]|uniref:uncharacterized protein LOC120159784 n=1 Tax=Hibiscus syriacus TaxID=106335 RepID=UPI0019220610|nr:uncharacterized protein LOC120159784 [Hibiscus syriacus]